MSKDTQRWVAMAKEHPKLITCNHKTCPNQMCKLNINCHARRTGRWKSRRFHDFRRTVCCPTY